MYKQRMIVLTKSYKQGGYCVAGIDSNTGRWVRIVTKDNGAIPKSYCKDFGLKDEIEVDIEKEAPTEIQPENLLVNCMEPAKVIKRNIPWADIEVIHPYEECNQIFDRWYGWVRADDYRKPGYSLMLIKASNFKITLNGGCKADFEYNGYNYKNYSITDPDCHYMTCDQEYLRGNCDGYNEVILVVSIGEAFISKNQSGEGELKHYKFIAAIYPLDGKRM